MTLKCSLQIVGVRSTFRTCPWTARDSLRDNNLRLCLTVSSSGFAVNQEEGRREGRVRSWVETEQRQETSAAETT